VPYRNILRLGPAPTRFDELSVSGGEARLRRDASFDELRMTRDLTP